MNFRSWSGQGESNSLIQLGRLMHNQYAMPACWISGACRGIRTLIVWVEARNSTIELYALESTGGIEPTEYRVCNPVP